MKKLFVLLVALATFSALAQSPQPATLFGAEAYDVPSKIMKSNIRVSVSVPMGYDAKSDKKYPVLYVLDAFYSFPLMHEMHKMMAGEIEPAIIVGIGDDRMSLPEWIISRYPVLNFDNVAYEDSFHVANLLRGAPVKLHSGDGAQYYNAIKTEVIPFIEANYKTSDDRGLTGHSLSSLFASHVMFKDPGYFSKIGINSAPLFVNDDETMRLEKAFFASKKKLSGKVFISASSLEGKNLFEKRALNLANALKSRNYPGLNVTHHVFQDESHVSEIGALTGKILYYFYGLPVDRSLGKGHKADK
ncbi:alpha/beta hydrolase-fold protein [Aquirufa sp. 2-AUSEE-184A6]|uniref:Alpha/beta hydrolase-fold protein n=1 Tax=Aquirufa novilacunae TaxID=3139305 RepID=A0ABW8SWT8_9BACT